MSNDQRKPRIESRGGNQPKTAVEEDIALSSGMINNLKRGVITEELANANQGGQHNPVREEINPVEPKQPPPVTETRKKKSAPTEPPRQMNVTISRQHFREGQRLMTNLKLAADEQVNKNLSQGNFFEFLIELGREQYQADPDRTEEKLLEFIKKQIS